jgi:hypothetical protein
MPRRRSASAGSQEAKAIVESLGEPAHSKRVNTAASKLDGKGGSRPGVDRYRRGPGRIIGQLEVSETATAWSTSGCIAGYLSVCTAKVHGKVRAFEWRQAGALTACDSAML